MSYVQGEDRGQAVLLPAAIEDYVAADAPVRVPADPSRAGPADVRLNPTESSRNFVRIHDRLGKPSKASIPTPPVRYL